MGIIHPLSPHLADLIAAGEVVERPASVVKELLENAVDAGSRAVTLEIENGGISLMRVTDNGTGMSPDDAKSAFLRHATSKIQSEEDLGAILTLGFRGEALAAIAAVSKIELETRQGGAPSGTRLTLSGGVIADIAETACAEGTSISVRDLFFNTPARMKFLKKAATEGMYAVEAASRIALSHPEVSIRVLRDGREVFHTPGDGELASAVYAVCGREFASTLIPISGECAGITVWGQITRPERGRANRAMQYFFLNGRHIKNRTMQAALEEAYRDSLMVGRFPGCVLHAAIDPAVVDVNVHPAKTEVKFSDERTVFSAFHRAAKAAILAIDRPVMTPMDSGQNSVSARAAVGENAVPLSSAMPPHSSAPDKSRADTDADVTVTGAGIHYSSAARSAGHVASGLSYTGTQPVQTSPEAPYTFSAAPAVQRPDRDIPDLLSGLAQPTQNTPAQTPLSFSPIETEQLPLSAPQADIPPASAATESTITADAPSFRIAGELFATYIVVELENEILYIDKHAAHERVIYNRLKDGADAAPPQLLLSPVVVPVSREEAARIEENRELLSSFGLLVEDFGGDAVIVREMPAYVDASDAPALISELAEGFGQPGQDARLHIRDHILHTMSCKAAIKAGRRSSPEELTRLVRQVLTEDELRYCPHGRPIALTVTRAAFERNFRRT